MTAANEGEAGVESMPVVKECGDVDGALLVLVLLLVVLMEAAGTSSGAAAREEDVVVIDWPVYGMMMQSPDSGMSHPRNICDVQGYTTISSC